MYWDKFRILKIKLENDSFYNVFFTQYKNEWKLSSGVASYEEKDKFVTFKGYSGSSHSSLLEGKDDSHWSWDGILNSILNNRDIRVIPYEQFKEEFDRPDTKIVNKGEEGSC